MDAATTLKHLQGTGVLLDKEQRHGHNKSESRVNMFWNQQVQTDRTIPNNKLDITVRDKKKPVKRHSNYRR